MDAPRGARRAHAQRLGDPGLDGLFGSGAIEGQASTEKEPRIEVSQEQVSIGNRRFCPTAAIARRTRIRPGAVWPDFQQPEAVDARDRPAAGANLDQVDHGHLDG